MSGARGARGGGTRQGAGALPVIRVASLAHAVEAEALRSLDQGSLRAYLAGRRWFGAKQEAPVSVAFHDVIPLAAPGVTAAVTRLDVILGDGRVERYQLPLALVPAAGPAGDVPSSALASVVAEDGATGLLCDALEDVNVLRLVARGLETGARYTDGGASWILSPMVGADVAGLGGLPVRASGAEQSNSTLMLGDRAVLKLYRRLEAGEQPDVEVARALAEHTDFRATPEILGTILLEDRDGAVTVAGMLQRMVPGARDAWSLALESALAFLRERREDPPNPFARSMRELGRVTRELHEALASLELPAFAPRVASESDVEEWAVRVHETLDEGTELLAAARAGGRLQGMDATIADAVLRRRVELLGDLDALAEAVGDHPGWCIRIHGDYHLGQVLQGSDGRFMIIDFEGEPARLLAERRACGSALRDVAGMLRSFSYAASAAALEVGGVGFNPVVEVRSARWERGVREAFLEGYLERAPSGFLPPGREAVDHLVLLFEMDKVFYELAYELQHRPDWVWIPLRGVGKLLGSPAIPRGRSR